MLWVDVGCCEAPAPPVDVVVVVRVSTLSDDVLYNWTCYSSHEYMGTIAVPQLCKVLLCSSLSSVSAQRYVYDDV